MPGIRSHTLESRFSKSTKRIESKNISIDRGFKAQDSYNICSPFVRNSACSQAIITVDHNTSKKIETEIAQDQTLKNSWFYK